MGEITTMKQTWIFKKSKKRTKLEHERNNLLAHEESCHAIHPRSAVKDWLGGSMRALRRSIRYSRVARHSWVRTRCQIDDIKDFDAEKTGEGPLARAVTQSSLLFSFLEWSLLEEFLSFFLLLIRFSLGFFKTRTFRHSYVSTVIRSPRDTVPQTSGEVTYPVCSNRRLRPSQELHQPFFFSFVSFHFRWPLKAITTVHLPSLIASIHNYTSLARRYSL